MYKNSVLISQEIYYGSATKISRLMLLGKQPLFIVETIANKYTVDIMQIMLKQVVHILTTAL
jgi:hypothetical protein